MKAVRSWRTIGVIGFILGIISFVITTILQWLMQPSDPTATIVDVVNQYPTGWAVASLLAILGPLAWALGIVALTALVRDRGWVLTTIGGVVTAIALIGGVGHLALYFGLSGDLAASGIDAASIKALERADDGSAVTGILLALFLVGFAVGPILLAIGLRRAQLLPVWVPVAAIIMTVANFVGGIPAGVVQLCTLLLTFVPMLIVLASGRAFAVRRSGVAGSLSAAN